MLVETHVTRYKLNYVTMKSMYGNKGTEISFNETDIKVKGTSKCYVWEDRELTLLGTRPYTCFIHLDEIMEDLDIADEIHFEFAQRRLYDALKEYKSHNQYDINDDITYTDWYESFAYSDEALEDNREPKLDLFYIAEIILRNVIKVTETRYVEEGDLVIE